MQVRTASQDVFRSSKDKENMVFKQNSPREIEYIMSLLAKNENSIAQIRKQLKQKVNKSQFLSGLSSKVSLSDITNISLDLDRHDQSTQNYSFSVARQYFQQQIDKVNRQMEIDQQSHLKSLEQLKNCMKGMDDKYDTLKQSFQSHKCFIVKEMKHVLSQISSITENKAERSELDKIMHLTSLLAIEFQLIKKRFSNFEVDYNLIWKEISNLYTNHESLKSNFDTQLKETKENTVQKHLQVLLKTSKNIPHINSMFNSFHPSAQKQQNQQHQLKTQQNYYDKNIQEKLSLFHDQQIDHNFSINNILGRLEMVQYNIEQSSKKFKQIEKMKQQYQKSKEYTQYLIDKNQKLKTEVEQIFNKKSENTLKQLQKSIGIEIKQACIEITDKMMLLFSQCSRVSDFQMLRNDIECIQNRTSQKIGMIINNSKKDYENLSIKIQQSQDKIKLLQKDINIRLKIEQFQRISQSFITVQTSSKNLKKTQDDLKRQLNTFIGSQKQINEVICAENIVARWIWISGELRGGNLVSWDKEIVNTLPQNFLYSNTQYCFKITSSGIYKIEMGFYAKKKPSIQIIANGQAIISAINSNSYVVHHSSGKLKDISKNQITGITYYDYFTLQQNCRLAISYSGQIGHGFFGIQRL